MHLACFFTYVSCRILFTINIIYFFAQLPEANLVILSSLVVQTKADNTIKKASNEVSTVNGVEVTNMDSTETAKDVVNNAVDTAVGYSWGQICLMGLGIIAGTIVLLAVVAYVVPPIPPIPPIPPTLPISPEVFSTEVMSKSDKIVAIMGPFMKRLGKCLDTSQIAVPREFLQNVLAPVDEIIINHDVKAMATQEFGNAILSLFTFVQTNKSTLNWTYRIDPILCNKVLSLALDLNTALANG
jgi:hypothetical protein